MADENNESVLDMKETETKTEKAQKSEKTINVSMQLSTLVLLLGIVCIFLRLFTLFLAVVGAGTVVTVFMCINILAVIATLALYVVDALKYKNFAMNATFIIMIAAVLIMFI